MAQSQKNGSQDTGLVHGCIVSGRLKKDSDSLSILNF